MSWFKGNIDDGLTGGQSRSFGNSSVKPKSLCSKLFVSCLECISFSLNKSVYTYLLDGFGITKVKLPVGLQTRRLSVIWRPTTYLGLYISLLVEGRRLQG